VIRAVITDCYGTLYPDPILAYRHDGKTPTHIVAALQDIHERAAAGAITMPMYIERAARLLQLSPDQAKAIFFDDTKRNQELLQYLGILRPEFKVAMLTNVAQGVIEGLFSPEERRQYFDLIIETSSVKTTKPDPAIFNWTCQQLQVEPAQAIMVDDRAENIAAARAIGMQGVQYHDFQQVRTELEALLSPDTSVSSVQA
jgi:FMN phosphatase YigB (HAD superfamily)